MTCFKDGIREPLAKECGWPQKAGYNLSRQLARKWGAEPYNHEELNSANSLNEQRNRVSPRASEKE